MVRLVLVDTGARVVATYEYDALNRRVLRSFDPEGDGTETVRYVMDGEHEAIHVTPTGNRTFVYGNHIDEVIAETWSWTTSHEVPPAPQSTPDPGVDQDESGDIIVILPDGSNVTIPLGNLTGGSGNGTAGNETEDGNSTVPSNVTVPGNVTVTAFHRVVRYYHGDDQGSIVLKTDMNGTVVGRYEYEPYGKVLIAGEASPYYFTGRNYDEETGLYYFRSRMMSPELQRFVSIDTIGVWGDACGNGNGYATLCWSSESRRTCH